MIWIPEEKVMCYSDEYITIRSTSDNSVLFTGVIRDLKFVFNFLPDNMKENNTVECILPGLAECKFYPFHILGSAPEVCKSHYNRISENKSADVTLNGFSQQIYSFENKNGEILFTARLLKATPKDWVEKYGGGRRRNPPYDLLHNEKIRDTGYKDSIYLDPIKQLILAGRKNAGNEQLSCSIREWYYPLEEHITAGRFTYPDGRLVIVEDAVESPYSSDRKWFRPGVIVRDYVELGGEKVWYAANFSPDSTDESINATFIFKSNYAEDALVRFEGSFTRKSVERHEKVPGKILGFITYYRIIGTVTTIGRDGGETSEYIDLYGDESAIEMIAVFSSKQPGFAKRLLDKADSFSVNKKITAVTKPTGLDDLVGLEKVKQTFAEFKEFGKYKQILSLDYEKTDSEGDRLLHIYKHKTPANSVGETSDDAVSLHMAFLGSPGTGKTTVAERVAAMLKEYNLVVTNETPLVVVKSDLVGQHIGHTEEIVRKKIEEAIGGILFVDEAYSLFDADSGNDFGKIAINEIMYAMERRRDKLVVILAGYTDEMLYMLKNANPGLTSRISWYFYFDDYSAEEMWEILKRKVEKSCYRFDDTEVEAIEEKVLAYFSVLKKEMDGVKEEGKTKHFFGNGRGVRTFFHYMQIGLATRLANNDGDADLRTFRLAEVDFAYDKFGKGLEKLIEEKVHKIGFGQT